MGDRGIIYKDDLTGIYNKRYFHEINKFIKSHNITFILFDIDDFKYVNDVYGHYAGDMVIKEIGRILLKYSNETFHAIRFGGDEFIIIIENANLSQIENIVKNIQSEIINSIINIDNKTISITCSFGISIGKINNVDLLMKQADLALYSSKEKGKNCYTIYNPNIKKINYFPFPILRKISLSMTENKLIIIKGSFRTGKTFIVNLLKNKFKNYEYVNFDTDEIKNIHEQLCVFYNPALIMNNKEKTKKLYLLKKKFDYKEFVMNNLSKIDILNYFNTMDVETSLLRINFVDLISSGNIGILSDISKRKLLDYDIVNYEQMEILESLLNKKIIDYIKYIIPLGLRFSQYSIKHMNMDKEKIKYLCDMLILSKRGNEYVYNYPTLYFYFKNKFSLISINKKYDVIFNFINSIKNLKVLNEKEKIDLSENIFNYGDIDLSELILNNIKNKHDKYHELKAKILLEKNKIEEFKNTVKKIQDKIIKKKLYTFYYYRIRKFNKIEKHDDLDILLVYILSNSKNKETHNLLKNINTKKLSIRQKVIYNSIIAQIYKNNNDFNKAVDAYKNAINICLRNHFITDYAKLIMQLALLYDDMKKYSEALKLLKNALLIFRISKMENAIMSCNSNIAIIYANMGDYNKAIGIYSQMLTNDINPYYRAYLLHNLSEMYLRLFHIDRAMEYNSKVIAIYKDLHSEIPEYVRILKNLISLLKDKNIEHIAIEEDMDIIDKYDIMLINAIQNSSIKEFINELLNNNKLDIIYKEEILIYLLYYYRKHNIMYKFIIKLLNEQMKMSKRILRKKIINKIMEEK